MTGKTANVNRSTLRICAERVELGVSGEPFVKGRWAVCGYQLETARRVVLHATQQGQFTTARGTLRLTVMTGYPAGAYARCEGVGRRNADDLGPPGMNLWRVPAAAIVDAD